MAESWIKLHTDILHDPKILHLHPYGRLAWVGLLLIARTGLPPGTWRARSRDTVAEDLCCVLRMDDDLTDREDVIGQVSAAVENWERCGMVAIAPDGTVTIIHWSQRQGDLRPSSSPDKVRERKRLSRMSRNVTRGHARSRSVTPEEREERDQRDQKLQLLAPQNGASVIDAFERFWLNYPRQARLRKAAARKAWQSLKPNAETSHRILAGLEAWRQSRRWTKDGGEFVPYPQKFLARRDWETPPGQGDPPRLDIADITPGKTRAEWLATVKEMRVRTPKAFERLTRGWKPDDLAELNRELDALQPVQETRP